MRSLRGTVAALVIALMAAAALAAAPSAAAPLVVPPIPSLPTDLAVPQFVGAAALQDGDR